MANPKVFDPPLSEGQPVPASSFNALDAGQFYALVRNGSSPLLANSAIQLGGYTLDFTGGSGNLRMPATLLKLTGVGWVAIDARTETDWVPPAAPVFASGEYEPGAGFLRQLGASKTLIFNLCLPISTSINAVRVPVVKPAAASFPTTRASIAFNYVDLATGAVTNVATANDPSANEAAYETHHLISITGLTHTVIAGRAYYVTVLGDDNSSDATDGLKVFTPKLDLTISQLRPL